MSNKPNYRRQARPRPTPTTAAEHRRVWESPVLWVVGLVAIALAVTVALSAGSGDDTEASAVSEIAFAEILGEPLAPLGSPDTAVGQQVPTIAAQTFSGDRRQIGGDGQARLYGFFAHWCPHCQAELPRTVEWLGSNELPEGVDLVAVSTGVESTADNFPPSAWFNTEQWPETVVVDDADGSLATGFGLTGFPYWVAADADGTVVQRVSGELSTAQFEALLASIAGSATDTPAAVGEPGIRLVSPADAAAMQADPPDGLIVLDVRTPDEFAEGHLEDAVMIDFYAPDFADQLAQLDPGEPYLLYCRSGNRSGQARAIMADLGFTDVADIDGGILGWVDAGLPVKGN